MDAAGRIFQAEGAPGKLPDELLGKTVWEINPIVVKLLESHGALAVKRVLSTVIRIAGAATTRSSFAPPSNGSSEWIAKIFGSHP